MRLLLVGIGTGNPDHLTAQAAQALAGADLILIPDKGAEKADLAALRHLICDSVAPGVPRVGFAVPQRDASGDYQQGVSDWHDAIAAEWARAIGDQTGTVALLVWGDPSLYDSTLRIAERLHPRPEVQVIPGITALQMLTAAHAIPLNTVGGPVTITTGRQLRDHGWPEAAETVAVMLDGACSFQALDPAGLVIWWGAFLGMDQQILDHGPLDQAGPRILAARAEARAVHGWIMDIYLLRKVAA
ncbi:MAG: precorrin-6A synthase (deacetylating) [Paracoccus sp. (in: a-proteobacteria)]|uniref:precorrin-6A synthase (deacetylating) n=1 Tax=Paracoccus sp. TaxID=267 RepID=UPI0026DEB442|nr:precorrin-6A synthase (deacetylating) [Paracoccus sp. (in: a-proteobacteria)]MDO5620988.1 precorrin-6A synthase (deacetylating) [Paracoccus sp. (in: a-proteobacteria)]